ncbi:MAG: transcriptional regulator, Crp/Fnr family [Rhizorhabdus sp.]|nr:transcriptional regulator, Crp/Fnr family [Rhizorhabdus sp.]
MTGADRPSTGNALLAMLSEGDFGRLSPHLTHVVLNKGERLIHPYQAIEYSWFPTEGIASVVIATTQGHETEVGIIGRDGMIDIATVHALDRSEHQCFIQIAGAGYRMPAAVLRAEMDASPGLRGALMAYAYEFLVQVSGTALANASFTIEQRLARWLLMCHDRIDGDAIPLTHEFLSLMLNVRRAGVTIAVQTLERLKLVETRRGLISIVDRAGLEELTRDSYAAPEPLAPAA